MPLLLIIINVCNVFIINKRKYYVNTFAYKFFNTERISPVRLLSSSPPSGSSIKRKLSLKTKKFF